MTRRIWAGLFSVTLLFGVLAPADSSIAQDAALEDVAAVEGRSAEDLAASKALRGGAVGAIDRSRPEVSFWSDILPDLSESSVVWIAVVVILVLTLQTRPWRSWRNLDGLALALTALLLPLRTNLGALAGDTTGHTVQWWAYLLLTIVGVYWLLRGLRLLLSKQATALGTNVSEGAMTVLIVAGLCLAINTIATAPLSDGSRDGLIGGICFADTGKLPYGDAAGSEARSPLLYMLHAGAVEVVTPTYVPYVEPIMMTWGDRGKWLDDDAWSQVDLRGVRLVNGLLFILFISALAGLGHRLHSLVMGQTLVAIACVFPGMLECLVRPEIMLPATLIAWSLALAAIPRVGGLLSLLVIMLGGFASAWVWLALPVLFAYFLRHGWQAFGATIGLLGGAVAALVGIATLVVPTLPRESGAFADGALSPAYQARLTGDREIVIESYTPAAESASALKSRLWGFLLARDATNLGDASLSVAAPNGVDGASIEFVDVLAAGPARAALQAEYRTAIRGASEATRLWAGLRTMLEEIWKPEVAPATPLPGAWEIWASAHPDGGRWTTARRWTKVAAGVLALLVAFLLIRGKRPTTHQLYGGLLIVFAATMLARQSGAAFDWVWLLPALLAAFAAKGASVQTGAAPPPIGRLPQVGQGAPLITVPDEPRR